MLLDSDLENNNKIWEALYELLEIFREIDNDLKWGKKE